MSMIAMTHVEIILFDLLKCGKPPLQEARPLCKVRPAHVYSCYQVKETRGRIMIFKTKF